MSEKPILFKGDMVRAILDGTKTQTRRIMKRQPCEDAVLLQDGRDNPVWVDVLDYPIEESGERYKCPYGVEGEHLWLRESFAIGRESTEILYKADEDAESDTKGLHWVPCAPNGEESEFFVERYTPSIFMFRRMSRIDLLIKAVQVERVQDISAGDAMAEGCPEPNGIFKPEREQLTIGQIWFEQLWDRINGKRKVLGKDDDGKPILDVDISWAANPWVWIIEFERIRP